MGKPFVVREFDTIVCNRDIEIPEKLHALDEKHFAELEQFVKAYASDESVDALDLMRIGYRRNLGDTVTFNSNVGIIELPSGFQIEVLPKVVFDEDGDNRKTKQIFLKMLCCLREFEGKSFGNASLNVDRMNLYEIFINMYLQETRNLVKKGLKSSYIEKTENLPYFKGKLDINRHIRTNFAHKERFYMHYDEYRVNRPENRLVKATLCKLQRLTKSMENAKEIRQLLTAFEFVDASTNYEKDFAKVTIGRDTRDYELLIQWANVFLMNKSFTTFSGDKTGKALLFPMEKVFESYVAKQMRKVFGADGWEVTSQAQGRYLFTEPQNKFAIRPDLVIRKNGRTVILDTKWKRLSNKPQDNYGITGSDVYQMYVYSKKYAYSAVDADGVSRDVPADVWLLYPWSPEVKDCPQITFREGDGGTFVGVYFVNLEPEHVEKSLLGLMERIG